MHENAEPIQPVRFRVPYAHLFPLIGHRVLTPDGPGKLLQVFESRCAVVPELDSGKRVWHYRPEEIAPSSDAPARAQGTGFG